MRTYKNSIPNTLNWQAKTRNQLTLRDTIKKKRITLVTGPAGTGKTFVTVCVAFEELLSGRANGIVISRPIVPAGRSFGYLPGTLSDKLSPFMEPIWDTITDLNLAYIQRLTDGEDNTVEVVPLELMRGRTFTEKFVIIDEAQNTTPNQIEMAMTRLGKDSRMVFCGDVTQNDMSGISGLSVALNLFKLEDEFGIVTFGLEDIQREGITRTVIERFDTFYKRRNSDS
jgi:phosphate starvation-inducible protein PhoH and related proteins